MGSGRLRYRQALTIALVVIGYGGYYLCRSNFSVVLPMLVDDLVAGGMTADAARIHLGTVASIGVLAYALGKLVLGGTADFIGGRRTFLTGMGGAIVFTVLFSVGGGLPLFTMAWVGNRLVQSMGWAGLVKITSRWFSYSSYGAVMGVISLSYLFGDALAREFMSLLIAHGVDWRAVFRIAAATLFVIFMLNLVLLREARAEIGFAEPSVNPSNVFAASHGSARGRGVRGVLGPLCRSRPFWMVCCVSLGCTLVRETFNTWTPTYFNQVVGYGVADAAAMSALFPFFGGLSVIVSGVLGDRLGPGGREWIILCGLVATAGALLCLALLPANASPAVAPALVATVACALMGPYSQLAGAIALDFGGEHGSASSSAIIDGVGYLGGVVAGDSIARVSVAFGWSGAFVVLAAVAALASIAAAALWRRASGRIDAPGMVPIGSDST